MTRSKLLAVSVLSAGVLLGCIQQHEAKVQTALLPPPTAAPVQHTGKLWVELGDATWETQCRSPQGQRQVCFEGVRKTTFGALERSLWTSFPEVVLRDGDVIPRGDYLLRLDVTLDALAPDADGPGWSALAAGGFRFSRDGKTLHEEKLGSRSRASFAYGGALGVAAGEVVDAIAAHVAEVLGAVAEERPLRAAPLPAVMVEVVTPAPAPAPTPETAPVPAAPAPAAAAPAPPAEPAPVASSAPEVGALTPTSTATVSPPTTPVAAR